MPDKKSRGGTCLVLIGGVLFEVRGNGLRVLFGATAGVGHFDVFKRQIINGETR